jgi:hypothetical protein
MPEGGEEDTSTPVLGKVRGVAVSIGRDDSHALDPDIRRNQ